MQLEQPPRGLRNPVVVSMLLHAVAFVLLAFALVSQIRVVNDGGIVVVAVVIGLVILGIILTVAVAVGARNARRGHALIRERNLDATVATLNWTDAFVGNFVSEGSLLRGANPRGFFVDVAADANGLTFWRGGRKIVQLGSVPWAELSSVQAGRMQAVIGSRQIDTVRFEFDANPTLISPATLLSQRTPASVIVSELLVHRPVP